MKTYIIQRDAEPNFEFKLMNVQDFQVAQFESEYKGRVLAKGNNAQEAIIAFSQKENQWEPLDIELNELPDQKINLTRRSGL